MIKRYDRHRQAAAKKASRLAANRSRQTVNPTPDRPLAPDHAYWTFEATRPRLAWRSTIEPAGANWWSVVVRFCIGSAVLLCIEIVAWLLYMIPTVFFTWLFGGGFYSVPFDAASQSWAWALAISTFGGLIGCIGVFKPAIISVEFDLQFNMLRLKEKHFGKRKTDRIVPFNVIVAVQGEMGRYNDWGYNSSGIFWIQLPRDGGGVDEKMLADKLPDATLEAQLDFLRPALGDRVLQTRYNDP